MKNSGTITLIVFLSIIVVLLVGVLILGLTKNEIKFLNIDRGVELLNEEYDNKNLNIEVKTSDVKIKESENGKIKIIVHGKKNDKIIVEDKEDLTIKYEQKSSIGINFTKYYVDIYLPKGYKNELYIKTTTGDIKSDISLDNIKIDGTTGDIYLKEIINNTNIKLTTGDIKIKKITTNNESSIKSTTGDIEINEAYINSNTKIELTTGDISIDKINNNDIYISAETTTGDKNIADNNRKSDIELKVNTKTGDIKIG